MLSLAAFGLPLSFANPFVLAALASLPIIWYLLRLTPPKPVIEPFPPIKILAELVDQQETPHRSPWWLTLLRLLMAALVIFAMALPSWNPQDKILSGEGPLLMIVDNGWAAGNNWDARMETIKTVAEEAQAQNREIAVINTAQSQNSKLEIIAAQTLLATLSGWKNLPLEIDLNVTAETLNARISEIAPGEILYFSDGIAHKNNEALKAVLNKSGSKNSLFLPKNDRLAAISHVQNDPDTMVGTLIRPAANSAQTFNLIGYDKKGVSVTRHPVTIEEGKISTQFKIKIPVELRNDIIRLEIENVRNAGAIKLLDESNRRRLVGLISGEKHDNSQPLLSPLYYISRALEPFSDIRTASDANVETAVPDLINQGVSTIVLADIGHLPADTIKLLGQWISRGGMLIRFAGPRLAANPQNELLPVRTRNGDRNIGGALSWEKPKPVAQFELESPFFGLAPPHEVFVKRQVLALQDDQLASKTWASLEDGTPLVTAEKIDAGWVVLFHVSSDASWSNLPISGTFVEMLRRVVNQSRSNAAAISSEAQVSLPPFSLLDGKGRLTPPGIQAHPLTLSRAQSPIPSYKNHPGFYGTSDGLFALNLLNKETKLLPLDHKFLGENTKIFSYSLQHPLDFKPWLLLIAAILFAIDCLVILWMAGALGKIRSVFSTKSLPVSAALLYCFIVGQLVFSLPASAQNEAAKFDEKQISSALKTRLAYVITGVREIDQISHAGLHGLSLALKYRTAIEPGEPIGIDIATDELAFYPLIYWPIHTASEIPDNKTMARIDAFMKQGGSVLFDTRDQNSSFTGNAANSPQARYLQNLLSNLDIPPLEPVPSDHVLTKSFFILNRFPGRYAGGELWVEQLPQLREGATRPVRAGDGVSSLMITSNDFAGAWAVDATLSPLFPTVPPNPIQREMAFRVGINLIMYAMTGNYKADQVHIPALLKRLGQ